MEIKSIPEIIKEMDSLFREEKYEEALQFARENIDLNKEYIEGEYVFKNLLEEILFQITINKEIKRKYPLILDYSTLYSNYGNVLLHFNDFENALKSFELSNGYNPVNLSAIFGLSKIYKQNNDWDAYYNLTIQSFKYSYTRRDLAQSFKNLSLYYLNEFNESSSLSEENLKLVIFLNKMALEYDDDLSYDDFKDIIDEKEYDDYSIGEIEEYLKSKGLPYGPGIEVITICKNLGFQLDEDKKVVPALFYFNIVYDLTEDPNIKELIDDLNAKVERRLNE